MGVGLGVGDVGAAGDEVADPGAQLFVEVEFAVLVAGEVLPVEGLPALGGLLRAEPPAGVDIFTIPIADFTERLSKQLAAGYRSEIINSI